VERTSTLSSFVVMACTAVSRLFGFVKIALIGALFGASGNGDVVNVVFAIPNDLRKLFAEGAFSSAFIPVLSSANVEDPSGGRARRLARHLLTFQTLILAPLVALSVVAPQLFVHLLLDFAEPEKVALSAGLLRWMFSFILIVSLSATLMAVLNTHQSFVIAALSPLVFSVAIIACMLLLRNALGPYAVAVGVVVGGIGQLVFLLPAYLRKSYDLRPALDFASPDFRRALGLWVPFVASASVFTINQMVARWFASGLEDGSVSAISNSVVFLQLPLGVFTASVMTVLFPRMSREAAAGDTAALRETVSSGIEFLTVLLVPSAIFLTLYGREVIAVALQRGKFDAAGTLLAARALTGYAVGLLSLGLYQFLQRLSYSVKDYRTPLAGAVLVAAVDVGCSLVLKETPLRVAGLAYSNAIAFTVGLGFLWIAARRRLGRLGGTTWISTFARTAVGSAPMVALLLGVRRLWPNLGRGGSTLSSAGAVVGVTLLCIAVTLGMYVFLRVPYVRELVRFRGRRSGGAPPAP
jgi:putative peptidoglycan lipid II flippase